MIPDTYDSRHWLLSFLAENKREAERLRVRGHWEWPTHLPKRSKPWPRKSGLRGASEKPLMWRV